MQPFEFARDVFSRDGFTLLVDGQSQSHVDPADPARLFFEYVRRMGNVIDAFRIPGAPLRALHLGGGGLSLPRYVEATRPGSNQVVVEHDGALLEAVLARVPLPRDADIALVVSDAADAVARMARERADESSGNRADTPVAEGDTPRGGRGSRRPVPSDAALAGGADLVTVDLYTGLDPPAFVATPEFAREVLTTLAPSGIAVVNVADAAGLSRLRAQARAFARESPTAELLVAGAPAILAGSEEGNAILVVAPDGLPEDLERRLAAAGPHPADVLVRERLDFVLWGAC